MLLLVVLRRGRLLVPALLVASLLESTLLVSALLVSPVAGWSALFA